MNLRALGVMGSLVMAAGCAYNSRQPTYGDVPSYRSNDIISAPAGTAAVTTDSTGTATVTTTPSYPSQGAAAATQSGYSNDADRALVSRIQQSLSSYGSLATTASQLNISSQSGAVTVSGQVPTQQDRDMIDAVVRNTTGVSSVNDEMRVLNATGQTESRLYPNSYGSGSGAAASAVNAPTPGEIFSLHVDNLNQVDRTLAQRIIDGLREDSTLQGLIPKVDISVAGGKVFLRGTVQSEQQRQVIGDIVQRSVRGPINNELQVRSP
jgi:hyperosmotically inducible periplasmic protein